MGAHECILLYSEGKTESNAKPVEIVLSYPLAAGEGQEYLKPIDRYYVILVRNTISCQLDPVKEGCPDETTTRVHFD
jgi:hypothetical protein